MQSRRVYTRVALTLAFFASLLIAASSNVATASSTDIVLSGANVTKLSGHWSAHLSTDGGGSAKLTTPDEGWAASEQPLAAPTHYFEASFEAPANTPFQIWLRLRATANSKWNDSVWVQFANARHTDGSEAYAIGTTRALLVNQAPCPDCDTAEWGWVNGAYWLQQPSIIGFASSGIQTIRVQTREDGVEIDHIVLRGVPFPASAPGLAVNDPTSAPSSSAIVPKSRGIVSNSTAPGKVGLGDTEVGSQPAVAGISAPGGGGSGEGIAIPLPTPPPPSTSFPKPPTPTPTAAPAPPRPPANGGSFRMMTWNIHHGRTKSGAYDPAAQARFIAEQSPHIVALQEVQTWDENQPARYKALLEQYTGVQWHLQWAPVNGRSGTEGNVLLTRLPVTSSTFSQMHATGDHDAMYSNRSVAQATVQVGNVPVHVFSTHLDWYNTAHRTAQLLDMMEWTARFGARRIVGGDFNAWWGEYWIITMMGDYYDTWLDVTGSKQSGHTVNNAVRFDYLFRAKNGSDDVTPTRITAPSTTLSDHNPVIADYTVKP